MYLGAFIHAHYIAAYYTMCYTMLHHVTLYYTMLHCVSDCRDGLGKEIVSRFSTTLNNNGTWYTDANGREIQKRV